MVLHKALRSFWAIVAEGISGLLSCVKGDASRWIFHAQCVQMTVDNIDFFKGQFIESEYPNIYTTTNHKNLFALLIGINKYGGAPGPQANDNSSPRASPEFVNLRGAVADANAFKDYLLHTLKVDISHITMLLDEDATRHNIIDAFQKLATNDKIKEDDSIFIFFAGHGAQALPPKRLADFVDCPENIELIIPFGSLFDAKDHQHMAIPDFTLAALLDKIAKKKGNHITLAFDCCHSASSVRGEVTSAPFHNPDPEEIARAGPEIKYRVPDDLDADIWGGTRALSIIPTLKNTGSGSYVLFSACLSTELAKETRRRGFFSEALLKILNELGPTAMTCSEIAIRLEKRVKDQHPQCEGHYSEERPFFQGYTSPSKKNFFFFDLIDNGTTMTLKGGEVHGLSWGDELTVFEGRSDAHQKNPVATVVINKVYPHTSTLNFRTGNPASLRDYPGVVALLTKASANFLKVYVGPKDHTLLDRIKALDSRIPTAALSQAHIALSVDKSSGKQIRVAVVDRDILGQNGNLNLKPQFIDDSDEDLAYVIKRLAHYYRHLKRTSPTLKEWINKISISFYQVEDTGRGHPRVVKMNGARNLCQNNVINISVADSEQPAIYGLEVTSNTEKILFPVLFYFDNTTFTIKQIYPHNVSLDNVEISWPAQGQAMTIGYGVGIGSNIHPFCFQVNQSYNMEAGFFKLFLFEKSVNLQGIVQEESVFVRSRTMFQYVPPPEWTSTDRWGTITIPVIQRRVEQR